MGLIKTAMMAGAGMYAVNKITQASENRRQTPSPQRQYVDQGASQQRYYDNGSNQSSQQQQQRGLPMEFSDRRGPQQQGGQQQHLLTNDASAPAPVYGYDTERGHYYEINPQAASTKAPAMAYANAGSSPPPPQYQTSRQGFVEPDEASVSEYSDGGRRNSNGGGSGAFINTLMENVGGSKGGKGKDFMSKLMK